MSKSLKRIAVLAMTLAALFAFLGPQPASALPGTGEFAFATCPIPLPAFPSGGPLPLPGVKCPGGGGPLGAWSGLYKDAFVGTPKQGLTNAVVVGGQLEIPGGGTYTEPLLPGCPLGSASATVSVSAGKNKKKGFSAANLIEGTQTDTADLDPRRVNGIALGPGPFGYTRIGATALILVTWPTVEIDSQSILTGIKYNHKVAKKVSAVAIGVLGGATPADDLAIAAACAAVPPVPVAGISVVVRGAGYLSNPGP